MDSPATGHDKSLYHERIQVEIMNLDDPNLHQSGFNMTHGGSLTHFLTSTVSLGIDLSQCMARP